jgi:hypothetical protein
MKRTGGGTKLERDRALGRPHEDAVLAGARLAVPRARGHLRHPRAQAAEVEGVVAAVAEQHCPDRKPPKRAVKRPARPYKGAVENRFVMENAKAA